MRERRARDRIDELTSYGGLLGRTRRGPVLFSEDDGSVAVRWVYRGVNAATDPALAELARRGELLRIDRAGELLLSFVYHDPARSKFALVLPEGLRHRVMEERAELLRSLGEEPEHPIPAYVTEARVVVGLPSLEAYLNGAPEVPESGRVRRSSSPQLSPELTQHRASTLGEGEDPFEELAELTPEAIERRLRELVVAGEGGVSALARALRSESSAVRLAAAIGLSRRPSAEAAVRLVDALIEEPTGAYKVMARLVSAMGGHGLAAARAAAEEAERASEGLVLALGHLAEAGFDLEVERMAGDAAEPLGELGRRGLDAIVDARDAVARASGSEEMRRDPIERLAARFEASLEN